MKKLIKIGVITFSWLPIVAIASTPSNPPNSGSSKFKLTQSFQTRLKKSFKISKWVEQTQSNSGSNITDGFSGTIFEDSRGNLWSMGYKTRLQKYNYNTKRWTEETSENSGSNITNGYGGNIFEDSRGNLWSMGNKTKLQKYDYQIKRWTEETSESSGSNIIDGRGGTIFEDSRGNLWSMGKGTLLQKYDYQTKRWTKETSESSGNNIIDGRSGTIFEDSRGNLWSMGYLTSLQKYDYKTKRWTTQARVGEKSSGSNIKSGYFGTIFEDSRGNLWSMGNKTKLQKYDYQIKRWTEETSESSGSNITDGERGNIFEDSRGNLWSMGNGTQLQKYNYQTKRWTMEVSRGERSNGSNIIDGRSGTIFEDSRGNLWSMGNGTPLQKYDYQTKRWTVETSENSGSNITTGENGTIFEDSRGNLWSMGNGTKLQKLVPIKIKNSAYQPIKNYNPTFNTIVVSSSKILLSIQDLHQYKSNLFSHLEYKKQTESEWKVVKNKIMLLDRANYNFRWVLGTEEILTSGQELPQNIIIKSDGSIKIIIPIQQIAKVKAFLNTLWSQSITKLEVLKLIQAASGYSDLTNAKKALITEDLISISKEPDGTLKVTIAFEGKTYKTLKVVPKPSKKESSKKDASGLSTEKIVGIGLGSTFGIGIIGFLIFYLARRNKK